MFESLRYASYRWIWLGQTAHAVALWAEMIALPLLVLEITNNSASQLGATVALRVVPMLALGPWAGVVADWFDRRRVLLLTKWANLILAAVLAALIATGLIEMWQVYAWVALRGASNVFDQPARYSMIPNILPSRLVTQGMALLSSTQNIMRIVGASGAGLFAEYLGLSWTFGTIAAFGLIALTATFLVRPESQAKAGAATFRSMAAGLVEGARYSVSNSVVRGVLIASLVYFTFGLAYVQVFAPLFAVEVLEIGRDGLGFMLALTGVGALIASLAIARFQPARLGLILPLTVVGMGLCLFLFSLSSYLPRPAGIVLPLVAMAFVGSGQTSFMAISRTVMLRAAPDHLRGRVLAVVSLDRAMMAVGGAVGGFLSAIYGVQPVQMAFGLICAAGGLIVLFLLGGLRSFSTADESVRSRSRQSASAPATN